MVTVRRWREETVRLSYDINLEQQQKLIITPELRQAIAVLQMSSLELGEYLDRELQENPFLEVADDASWSEAEKKEAGELEEGTADLGEWVDYFLDRSDLGLPSHAGEDKERAFENMLTSAPDLHDTLRLQLVVAVNTPEELRIGEYLIGCIDGRGYLCVTVDEAAQALKVRRDQVEQVLAMIKEFEPSGVGARDLKETMLIQLKHRGQLTDKIEKMIMNHLDEIGEGKLRQVARAMGLEVEEVQKMRDLLRTLNPYPGSQYGSNNDTRYIVPDITIEKVDGEYVVSINDTGVPSLRINRLYQDILRAPQQFDQETRKYLEERLSSAFWLLKSIEHRRLTLYRVAVCIAEMQREFLDNGIRSLRPMTLRQVAERVGVHESTISRAIANKYAQTPQGLLELKYFFSSGIRKRENEDMVSARSIKQMIKELIDKEDPASPLSDQQISDLLAERGLTCSRRTVAKYRGEMGIPNATVRRRY